MSDLNDEIATAFRATELERRAVRKAKLLNEIKLDSEKLSDEDKRIHDIAVKKLKEGKLELEKEINPGYWERLWNAIRGK